MVGVGILTTSGFTVASVHSHQWAWVLWATGGLLAVCGALTQAELVCRIPESGGDYVILRTSYGPLWGFLSGWLSMVLGFAGPIAASSKAAARYLIASFLEHSQPVPQIAVSSIATVIVLAMLWLHSHNFDRSARTQSVTTIVKIGLLAIFVVVGLLIGIRSNSFPSDWPEKIDLPLATTSLTSLIYISYAYTGWNGIGFIAGEVRNPKRNLPLSIFLGTSIVLAIYLGCNLVYSLAWTAPELEKLAQERGFDALAPIAELSARRLFGDGTANVISFVVFLMLIASVSAYVLTGARIIQAMGEARHFPHWASVKNAHGVPTRATILQSLIALCFVWSASLESIIVVSSIGLAAFSMLTISSIFTLRRQPTDVTPAFLCPLYPIVPAVFLGGTGILTVVTVWNKPGEGLTSLACVVVGIVAYFVWTWLNRFDRRGDKSPEQV
jgi:APA family basic amino acid/polyamine antiporter